MRLALLSALAAVTVGCAPSFESLLAEHRYDEARCALSQGVGEASAYEEALAEALDPALHVEAYGWEEVSPLISEEQGPALERLLSGHYLVRAMLSVNEIDGQVAAPEVGVELSVGGRDATALSLEAIERLTGERIPRTHVRRSRSGWFDILALLTGGTLYLVSSGMQARTIRPSREEQVAAAPAATWLEGRARRRCRDGRCTWWYLVERGDQTPEELEVTLRVPGGPLRWVISLPPGAAPLPEKLGSIFGRRMRRLQRQGGLEYRERPHD